MKTQTQSEVETMAIDDVWRRVTAAETQALLDNPELLVYDARDPASFAAGRIGAARPLSDANLEQVLFGTPKSRPVLVYCYHGNASQTYAQMFRDFGFKEIYDLIDGYEAWRAAGLQA
jgi:rhodanese-related sulfurtransferase